MGTEKRALSFADQKAVGGPSGYSTVQFVVNRDLTEVQHRRGVEKVRGSMCFERRSTEQ